VPRLILDYDKRAWITLDCEEIEEILDSAEKITIQISRLMSCNWHKYGLILYNFDARKPQVD
jgi:hypothetical protein